MKKVKRILSKKNILKVGLGIGLLIATALYVFMQNPLDGEWVIKSQGRYVYVNSDDKFTLKGLFGDVYAEVELSYNINIINHEITLKVEDENTYLETISNVKGSVTEDKMRENIEPLLSTYNYCLEKDTLTLTNQRNGEQTILERVSKIKLDIATTTGDVKSISENEEEEIKKLYESGFKYIDLSLYYMDWDSPWMQDEWRGRALSLKKVADELGMEFVLAHSPGTNPLGPDRALALASNLRAIEICEVLGIQNIVVHAGSGIDFSKEEWFEKNKAFYNELLPTAEKCGVNVLCENSTSKNVGTMYYINSGADMLEFIEYVNHPYFHGCWDTGHANCEGSQYDDILTLNDEIYAIHYTDNLGDGDTHLMPYYGNTNIDEVMLALNMINFKGYFTLESIGEFRTRGVYTGPILEGMTDPYVMSRMEEEKVLYQLTENMLKEHDMLKERP